MSESFVQPGSFLLTLGNPQALPTCYAANLAGDDPHGLDDRMIIGVIPIDQTRPENPTPAVGAVGLSHRLISIIPWMILDDEYVDGRSSIGKAG